MSVDVPTRVNLICAKVEILKLKADAYSWQCNCDEEIRHQLEATLLQIDLILGQANKGDRLI